MRKRGRTDANQTEIVETLRKMGLSVCVCSALGNGVPDILVGYGGRNYLIEIKDGDKAPSKRALTEDESDWHNRWRGQATVCCTVQDVLRMVGIVIRFN